MKTKIEIFYKDENLFTVASGYIKNTKFASIKCRKMVNSNLFISAIQA